MTNPHQHFNHVLPPELEEHRWHAEHLEFFDPFGHMPGEEVPETQQQQPVPLRHLGPLPPQQAPAQPAVVVPPMLDPVQPQGYYHRPYQEHGTSAKLDKFDSLLPKAGEERNTLYGHVSRTLGRTLTSPSDAPSTASPPKSIADLESSNDSAGVSNRGGEKPTKICEVCGDRAKSFHFGGVSCDSCKAFFRRAVHSDNYNSFRCAYNNSCVINISNRKTCQACRFKKCIQIGMEKKWIMTEEERSLLQKQRLEKKQKKVGKAPETSRSPTTSSSSSSTARVAAYEPDVSSMLKYMTAVDQEEIEWLVRKFHQSYKDIPYKVAQSSTSRNSIEIIEMFTTILRRMVYFHKNLPDFNELSQEDQSTLLRQGVLEMCMLRSALTYDFKNNRWPVQTGSMEFLRSCPILKVEDMKKLVSPDLYKMQMEFISGIQELQADEPIVTLLSLIVLFYPDRTGLIHTEQVTAKQEKYLQHLQNYIHWRFGPQGSKMYARFLTKLSDLRQLNDSHNEYNLRLAQREVNQIQEQLSSINLNPYTTWDLVKYDKDKTVGHVQPASDPPSPSQAQQGPSQCTREVPVQNHSDEKEGQTLTKCTLNMSQSLRDSEPKPPEQQQQPPSSSMLLQNHQQVHHNQHNHHQNSPQDEHKQPEGDPPERQEQQQQQLANGESSQKSGKYKPSFVGVLFSQMVNRHIPLLMEDPMASISSEQELATVSRYFTESGMCKMAKMSCSYGAGYTQSQPQLITATSPIAYDPDSFRSEPVASYGPSRQPSSYDVDYRPHHNHHHHHRHHNTNRPTNNDSYFSSIKNILDSLGAIDDPNVLQRIKESLNPTVLRQLRDTFSAGNSDTGSSHDNFGPTPPRTPSVGQSPTWAADRAANRPPEGANNHVAHNHHHQHHHHETQLQQQQPPQIQQQQPQPPNPIISEKIQDILQSFGYNQRSQEGYHHYEEHPQPFHLESNAHPPLPPPNHPEIRENREPFEAGLIEPPAAGAFPQDCSAQNTYQYEQTGREYSEPRNHHQDKGVSHKYPW